MEKKWNGLHCSKNEKQKIVELWFVRQVLLTEPFSKRLDGGQEGYR